MPGIEWTTTELKLQIPPQKKIYIIIYIYISWRKQFSTKTPIANDPKPWMDNRQNLWTIAWMNHQTNRKAWMNYRQNLWTIAGTNHQTRFRWYEAIWGSYGRYGPSRRPLGNLSMTSSKPLGTSQKSLAQLDAVQLSNCSAAWATSQEIYQKT